MWCENPADLFRLATLVGNDVEPTITSAAYLFGHTKQCEWPILRTGAELIERGMTQSLWICALAPGYPHNGSAENPTYRDFDAWRKELATLGVSSLWVNPIESPRQMPTDEKFPVSHTGTEAERFVLLAKERSWKSVHVVSHPMHILRAFTQTVGFTLKEYPTLRVYAKTQPPQSWHAHATLNQGIVSGMPFVEGIDQEWRRLSAVYGNKYDPIPAAQVIEYLNWRASTMCAHPDCPFPHDIDHVHCNRCGFAYTNDPDAINQHPNCPALR